VKALKYRRIKGTRDILPEELKQREKIFDQARNLFEAFGYLPILTPIFEMTELFVRGIGEASDIVQKEMYTFADRSGRSLTLRPEGTAPVVRAYLENNLKDWRHPTKLYYIMPMYRYERPQKGRLREFWQIGLEVFGSQGPEIDSEIIFLMVEYFRRLGLQTFTTEINTIGCRKCRPDYLKILRQYIEKHLADFCPDCQQRYLTNPLRVFDCKNKVCNLLLSEAPLITDHVCDVCREHFEGVKSFLEKLKVDFTVNKRLVRGLDYYEKTTFEVKSPLLGAQSAVGGGGRYDPLIEDCGGEPTPGIGFAIGVERLLLQLSKENLISSVDLGIDVYVVSYKGYEEKAFDLATKLRLAGFKTELDYQKRSMKAQFKQADKLGAKLCLILAPEEDEKGLIKIRDMISGEEEVVKKEAVFEAIEKKLVKGSAR
jgi:histidyl-tRNA synthetase